MSDYSELMSDLRLRHEHKAAEVIENLLSDREKQRRLLDSLRGEVTQLEARAEKAEALLEAIRKDEQCAHWHEDIDTLKEVAP